MDQHGPEVIPEYPGLEVVPNSHVPPAPHYQYKADEPAPPLPIEKGPRKGLWWIVGGVVLVLVIVSAVVGGVIGSRTAGNRESESNPSSSASASVSSTESATPKTTAALKSIRPNSNLAVTGYRGNGDFRARLFYSGPDNVLRHSDYNSASDAWTSPAALDNLAPIAKSPIAASTFLNPSPPQINLYFVDETSLLRGQRFQDGVTPAKGSSADINAYPLLIDSASRLSAYYPHVVSQDSDGKVRWMHWTTPNNWDNHTFDGDNATGSPSSGLVALSAAVLYFKCGAFIYRNAAGDLSNFVGSTDGSVEDTWAWSQGELAIQIPADTAIGAFAYARSSNLINTYTLYQDDKGVLQVIWQDDSSGWKGPETYSALAGADKGTNIACLTQAAWDQVHVNLSAATDMNRCYFQSGGKVKEVLFDGEDWKDLGYLPIT